MNYDQTLMWKEINETGKIFDEIIAPNQEVIDKLVKEIELKNIKNVVAAGRGTSDHALIFFKYATEILTDMTVGLAAPSVITMYNGKISFAKSIVIGVSQSGKAQDVLEVLKRANSQGAVTIAVTNHEDSPMAREAKYHLFCNAGLEKSVAATKTFSAQLFLLLLLTSKLAKSDSLQDSLRILGSKVKRDLPFIDIEASKFVDKFKNMKSGFVLARGVTFPICLEATLKLQETSYIQMKGYASSDFYHGPMAMVSENTPIIIYAPKCNFIPDDLEQNHYNDFTNVIDKMLSLNAPVLVVTDDERYLNKYENVALLPKSENEFITMFSYALFAQIFACKISCGIGNNPDSPRALNKVTITK